MSLQHLNDSYSVCQIREDKTYLKLSTSRLKLVLSFSAISSLLSICSLALLSLSRSRSISAFSLRDCSRSCSTANKSYLRKTEKLSVMKTRILRITWKFSGFEFSYRTSIAPCPVLALLNFFIWFFNSLFSFFIFSLSSSRSLTTSCISDDGGFAAISSIASVSSVSRD